MDAAQALADLTEVSSQIETAVLADEAGKVVAATLGDEAKAQRVAAAAAELLRAADAGGRQRLVQLEAATPEGSVFVVRDEDHLVAAVTGRQPTVGLVFYDLKTCLRLVKEQEAEPAGAKPARPKKKKEEAAADEA